MTDLITNRPPCADCHRPTRSAARPNDPGRPLGGNGLCDTCYHRSRRHVIQPPGTARARQRAPGQFAADYTELKEMGVHGDETLCGRMGMKPLSYRRAYERARKKGELT